MWSKIKLFKTSSSNLANHREKAEHLYKTDFNLSLRIALGQEKAPDGILAAAIYAKVCDEVEKSEDLELCRQIANSHDNTKLSIEAQKLKLRDPYSAIEKMKEVVNVRRKAYEKSLPKGKTYEMAIKEEMIYLKKFLIILENYAETILNSQSELKARIADIETSTNQYLEKEELAKEMWILRYAFLHSWFLSIKPPKNQTEFEENLTLINHAFQNILNNKDMSGYLPWLTEGLTEYIETNPSKFISIKKFQTHFTERVGEKIPRIAFNTTKGRLAGEQHDSVIELITSTVEDDRKSFGL